MTVLAESLVSFIVVLTIANLEAAIATLMWGSRRSRRLFGGEFALHCDLRK